MNRGLSATVGAPEKFNEWLESVQKAGGFQHKFVHYPHRYSHLRKFYYNIHEKPRDAFQGLSTYKTTERMRFLHPLSILSSSARSLPSDLALEAVDTLHLYRALSTCKALQPSILAALHPAVFFSSSKLLQQKDVIQYEEALKQHLIPLLSSFDSQDSGMPLSRVIVQLRDDDLSRIPDRVLNSAPSRVVSSENIIHLVADLHTQGDLVSTRRTFFLYVHEILIHLARYILLVRSKRLRIYGHKIEQGARDQGRQMAQN